MTIPFNAKLRAGRGSPLAVAAAAVLLAACGGGATGPSRAPVRDLREFEERIEALRSELGIPALSAAIASDGRIVWARGFGTADLERGVAAGPSTEYHLASLTKTFSSTVVLQLVEEGVIGLDDPVSSYGIELPGSGVVRVRHLLSHTSEGVPGTTFRYNGARFGLLDAVIVKATGQSFAAQLERRIIRPLGLTRTAPNPADPASFSVSAVDAGAFAANLARPYALDAQGRVVPSAYPTHFGTAAGLVASVTDVARYAIALDEGRFLGPETHALATTPARAPSGEPLPYALGWFVTSHGGAKVVWHYGYWTANSSLVVRIPERRLTFVIAANTDQLSARYDLGGGNLNSSPLARAFLEGFVSGSAPLPASAVPSEW
jgi:CubicO group peptidase (beta-lactamase class C family)